MSERRKYIPGPPPPEWTSWWELEINGQTYISRIPDAEREEMARQDWMRAKRRQGWSEYSIHRALQNDRWKEIS